MSRLFVALFLMSLLGACESRSASGVDSVATAQADAIECWVLNNHRPYSFVISVGGYGEPPLAVTRIHVRETGVERTEHIRGYELQALAKYYQPIDELHRAMARTLMLTQEDIVRGLIDRDERLVVSAKFERRSGVPLEFSYKYSGFNERNISWTISEFRFLD